MPAHVFVVGMDDFNVRTLREWLDASDVELTGLLDTREVRRAERYHFEDLLERARAQLDVADTPVDAITTWWDFPSTSLVPVLAEQHGCPGPSLEAVLRCEHKLWSRVEQARVAPEHVPRFQAVDPFDDDSVAAIDVGLPYWLKPVKSVASHLAFYITGPEDLEDALPRIRSQIARLGDPFNEVLSRVELPAEIAHVTGLWCIAEAPLAGQMATVEGWARGGQPYVSGIVDSVREPGRPSFARYEYPSRLPDRVQEQMAELARRVIAHFGYDDATFNVELFYDDSADRILLLEVNPRGSQSHADLFAKVDGVPNTAAIVEVALGRAPEHSPGRGPFKCAAKCFVRAYDDALLTRVPTAAELGAVRQIPGVRVEVAVREGMQLRHLRTQDSYSYELAAIFVGADDHDQLIERLERCQAMLTFGLLQ